MALTVRDPLRDLDKDQIRVAVHMDGPAMVIAGAGSGKTRALIQRIAHLVSKGVNPQRILATTFTRKATGEISVRLKRFGVPVEKRGEKNLKGARVGTIHSVAFDILKESEEFKFWEPNNDFPKPWVREIAAEHFGTPNSFDVDKFLNFMSLAKNYARLPDDGDMIHDSWFLQNGFEMYTEQFLFIYKLFEERRREGRLLTYDDMLLDAWAVLDRNPTMREKWQSRFDYILVDEAQDTNFVQFCLVETLSDRHKNYMIIGDPFQSIYSWRGAFPVYMQDFTGRFPDAVVYEMFRNYRCARGVLERANKVIGHAQMAGFEKLRLEPVRPEAGNVRYREFRDEFGQVDWVIDHLRMNLRGRTPGDFAIIYRTKAVGRLFEMGLERARIPSKRLDTTPFYDRETVKALVKTLSLVAHPEWVEAACFALDAVKFIGPKTLAKIRTAPGDDFIAKGKWIAGAPRGLRIQKRQCENVGRFVEAIEACTKMTPVDALDYIIDKVQFLHNFDTKRLKRDDYEPVEGGSVSDNAALTQDVESLRMRVKRFKTIDDFLDHVSALSGQKEDEHIGNKVALSTIHRVKGLEFNHVYLVSAAEGILPHKKSLLVEDEFPDAVEEERRLFYVASTRAKETLTISTPTQAYTKPLRRSRFIADAGLAERDEDDLGEEDQEAPRRGRRRRPRR
jgi:DNA helicase-2/ATP-dependent DNA helicase PcrA